jgi:diacylglycerol O-acyltransferase
MQQLSAQDTLFLNLETPRTPMHVGGLYLFNPAKEGDDFDFQAFRQFIEERLHLSRVFRQRLVQVPLDLSRPYWVEDPDFDLDTHLLHVSLPGSGEITDLLNLASQLYSKPLDLKRPLWEMTIVSGLDKIPNLPKGSYAMLAKVHHAAIDGMSGAEIMSAIFDMSVEPRKISAPKKEWKPESIPTGVEVVARSYMNLFGTPSKLIKFASETISDVAQIGAEVVQKALSPPPMLFTAPKTIFNVPVSSQKIFGGASFPLAKIKAMKDASPGTTVNDVVLAVCGGAIRKYLDEKGKLPKKSLITMAPVSVRDEKAKASMGNQVSAMLVSLGTNEADPLERLKTIRKSSRSSKVYSKALKADKLMELIPSELFALASRMYIKMELSEKHNPFYNTIITNVPGPPIPLFMNGSQLLSHYGMGVLYDGMGLMIVVFSYAGQITICATSCKEIMPDADRFGDLLRDSMTELTEALAQGTPVKTSKTTQRTVETKKPTPATRKTTATKKTPPKKQEVTAPQPEEKKKAPVKRKTTPRKTPTTQKKVVTPPTKETPATEQKKPSVKQMTVSKKATVAKTTTTQKKIVAPPAKKTPVSEDKKPSAKPAFKNRTIKKDEKE